jgi:hypothetical protein
VADRDRAKSGDRVEFTGKPVGPFHEWPQTGERGTIVMLDPHDDIIAWDDAGTFAWMVDDDDIRLVEEA